MVMAFLAGVVGWLASLGVLLLVNSYLWWPDSPGASAVLTLGVSALGFLIGLTYVADKHGLL